MNHIIVRESTAEIRAIARNALKDNWIRVVIGMFVYYILTTAVPELLAALIPGSVMTYYNELIEESYSLSYVASLYNMLLSGAFTLGLNSFLLSFFRKRDINPGYIFNGFEYFFKALGLMIVMGVFVFLWSLLFIIPGIIAVFRYSQAFFILADDPSKGIMECINESKYRMNGNKGKYFCLNLSFIGWMILSMLPVLLLPYFDGIAGIAADLVYSIPWYFFTAYSYTADVTFYDLVTGNLVARPEGSFNESDYHF